MTCLLPVFLFASSPSSLNRLHIPSPCIFLPTLRRSQHYQHQHQRRRRRQRLRLRQLWKDEYNHHIQMSLYSTKTNKDSGIVDEEEDDDVVDSTNTNNPSTSSLSISMIQRILSSSSSSSSITTTSSSSDTKSSSSSSSSSQNCVRLILASQSPRRSEILQMMGLKFDVMVSPLDESKIQKELKQSKNNSSSIMNPAQYAQILARYKAMALIDEMKKKKKKDSLWDIPTLVVGSDTIVDLNGSILEKPKNEQHAKEMLRLLSGQWHKVHTGVAICSFLNPQIQSSGSDDDDDNEGDDNSSVVSSFTDTADVQFAVLSDVDIDAYVATGEPMDKAGSYGIQGIGGQFVQRMEGDFFTVMGLPMHRFSVELAKAVSTVSDQ